MSSEALSNLLCYESSPYLLQHAQNPVHWRGWHRDAFELAQKLDRLVLISIGYSACHWCHVMEHESFEDKQTALLMNEDFICIKVDREERPDVDQVYLTAVELMTGQGGWPLNCFVLPDGRPIYGGTYFQKEQWQDVLRSLSKLWKNDRSKLEEYAQKLTAGVKAASVIQTAAEASTQPFKMETLDEIVVSWKSRMDFEFGGQNRAPKFPLPSNCSFLIGYAGYSKDASIDKYVRLTLNQMAFGGIYDQIGGGFSRYSTDMRWKVPHFEKMLYDNAQLISLYAEAFQFTGNNLYKEVATETIAFALRELQSESGLFYAAIDADSEGEEGKFYVWKKAELVQILGDLYPLAATHFNVNEIGYWEHDNYILIRTKEIVEFSKEIEAIKGRLLEERSKRKRPGTDTKLLTGWNGLIITALTKASVLLNEPTYKAEAIRAGLVLLNERVNKDGSLIRCKTSNSNAIAGFLEDYAFTIESFITLYQATFDESWIHAAENITKYAIKHFHDKDNGLFYFTGDSMEQLIARTAEIHDNVIPSSNSTMARNLYTLSLLLDQPDYKIASEKMLRNVLAQVRSYGEGYSNWCKLLLQLLTPSKQICIVGPNAKDWAEQIRPFIGSTTLLSGSNEVSNMPLLKNKFNRNKTLIYFCENTTCKAPFERIEDAIAALNNSL